MPVVPEEDEDVLRITYSRSVTGPIRTKLFKYIKEKAREINKENEGRAEGDKLDIRKEINLRMKGWRTWPE